MFSRNCRIWFGSSPAVGSSMISTSGSCSSACAMPTRCRYPRDSLPIGFSVTSSSAQSSTTASTRSSSAARAIRRASPKKRSSSSGVMSGYMGPFSGR